MIKNTYPNPEEIPKELTDMEGKTPLGNYKIQSTYGGPESKYQWNEDSALVHEGTDSLIVCVIDGAGGSGDGLLASQEANRIMSDNIEEGKNMLQTLLEANKHINTLNETKRKKVYATFAGIEYLKDGDISILALGDARALTLRNHKTLQEGTSTLDNLAQKLTRDRNNPADFYSHPKKKIILSSLGFQTKSEEFLPQDKTFTPQNDDRIILASDALWDVMSDYEIEEISKNSKTAKEMEDKLYQAVFERNNAGNTEFLIKEKIGETIQDIPYTVKKGFGDNITIAIVEIKV
ncbi:MAG: hypothetical protein V1848_00610 [Candidatus Magasanikbacteria bacterium]